MSELKSAKIQVILEYKWTLNRDLIDKLETECVSPSEFRIGSILRRIADEGFEIDDDHRISYYQPKTKLYVHLGRAADLLEKDDIIL